VPDENGVSSRHSKPQEWPGGIVTCSNKGVIVTLWTWNSQDSISIGRLAASAAHGQRTIALTPSPPGDSDARRYQYGEDRPGNPSVAYTEQTQLRDIRKQLPLRVLSASDFLHWQTHGYVIVKDAVSPEQVRRTTDFHGNSRA
jgi:hypothetical protein